MISSLKYLLLLAQLTKSVTLLCTWSEKRFEDSHPFFLQFFNKKLDPQNFILFPCNTSKESY